MDNLGVREVPPRERERERERFLSASIDTLSGGWKEEGRRNSVNVVVGEPVAKR